VGQEQQFETQTMEQFETQTMERTWESWMDVGNH
jgi:hypothetical protein